MIAIVELHNWSVMQSGDAYDPPEVRRARLGGQAFGHPAFLNGDRVVTSPITKVEGRHVWTMSTHYLLVGDPDPGYATWCKKNGIEIDPLNPIKVRT